MAFIQTGLNENHWNLQIAFKNKGKGAEREECDTVNAGYGQNLPGKPYSESLTFLCKRNSLDEKS